MSANYQGNLHPLLDSVKLSVRKKKKKLSPKSHSTQFSQEPHHYKFDFKKQTLKADLQTFLCNPKSLGQWHMGLRERICPCALWASGKPQPFHLAFFFPFLEQDAYYYLCALTVGTGYGTLHR